MPATRGMYTLAEDRLILRYIIDGQYGTISKGDGLWKKIEKEHIVPGRSWQSLRNRWRKYIAIDLGRPEYGLTQKEKCDLRTEINVGVRKLDGAKKPKAVGEQKKEIKKSEALAEEEKAAEAEKIRKIFSLNMTSSDEDS